jgi:hypothetical protein
MALTEAVRLRLEGAGFLKLFNDHEEQWTKMAEEAKALIASQVKGGEPTVDDIKKTLFPLIELAPELRGYLAKEKLTQKYWVGDFTDYVIHKVYQPKLGTPKKGKSK